MSLDAFILARSGSKGIKDKNLLKLGNRSLLEISIEFAVNCQKIDRVFLSTDSISYETLGVNAGATSLGIRPSQLAGDLSKTADVLIDAVRKMREPKPKTILLLQPTSPFRESTDVDKLLRHKNKFDADAAVSLYEIDDPHPNKMKVITSQNFRVHPFLPGTTSEGPRQLLPKVYGLTGAYYLIDVQALMQYKTLFPPNTVGYVMEKKVNIDNLDDYEYAQYLWDKERS